MAHIQLIQTEEALKIIGDSTRLAILRHLISRPATISQLGEIFEKHPAQIRNHILQLEKAHLVELDSVQVVKNYREKYYRATARAFFINIAIFAEPPENGQMVVLGSDDLALDLLARMVNEKINGPRLYTLPVGSLEGLIYLREKFCQISGCHLFDCENGEYNLPFVRHLFSEERMCLVTLSHRQQGFMVRPGNPLQITGFSDLKRPDLIFINRKPGSGTRMWLDQNVRALGMTPEEINGYDHEVLTHSEVGQAVVNGTADVGLGIYAVASSLGLDFIPLFSERYDLVMRDEIFNCLLFHPILEILRSSGFRQAVESLGGYDTTHTGEVIRL